MFERALNWSLPTSVGNKPTAFSQTGHFSICRCPSMFFICLVNFHKPQQAVRQWSKRLNVTEILSLGYLKGASLHHMVAVLFYKCNHIMQCMHRACGTLHYSIWLQKSYQSTVEGAIDSLKTHQRLSVSLFSNEAVWWSKTLPKGSHVVALVLKQIVSWHLHLLHVASKPSFSEN